MAVLSCSFSSDFLSAVLYKAKAKRKGKASRIGWASGREDRAVWLESDEELVSFSEDIENREQVCHSFIH